MAVEVKRGCGYRKVGGLYLVGSGDGLPCCMLPLPLTVCKACGGGIKQSRGWTTVNPQAMFAGAHDATGYESSNCNSCLLPWVLHNDADVGLLWVGEAHYRTVADFQQEAFEQGISKRLGSVPRDFASGKVTRVMLAHPRAYPCIDCHGSGYTEVEPLEPYDEHEQGLQHTKCETCQGKGGTPGVFRIFQPSGIEQIVTESQAKDKDFIGKLATRGITAVPVPDNDPDHNPNGVGVATGKWSMVSKVKAWLN